MLKALRHWNTFFKCLGDSKKFGTTAIFNLKKIFKSYSFKFLILNSNMEISANFEN